ncbi:MAG: manganese/iron transport system permease protein [Actinomycetota bacterium]|jgi:manganese/iron transport system permease protein/iron/zinc/copper transport system permease protein|nr:manganese/iron transport system permease protein [Actinomycetota bacterium]
MHWLTDPFAYGFFKMGLRAGLLGGALCGFLGVYVVLRSMSYIGHGLSHAIFGGAAVSLALGWNFYLGAGAWGILAALIINGVARRRKIGADAAIGVVTTASFALGVALISAVHLGVSLDALLFGNILGVTWSQLWVLVGVSLCCVGIVFVKYRQLLFATFDPEAADAYGVSSRWVDALFALMLAATIVATMKALGVTLIAAMIVVPAAIARLLTDSFAEMLLFSTLIGAAAGAAGMYVSFHLNVPPSSAIVLILAGVFAAVYVVTGVTSRRRLQVLGGLDGHTDLAPGAVDFD